MKKKILVIGATGLIGQAVAKQLNKDGFQVIALTRSREKAQKIFNSDFEIIEGDVLIPETVKHAFYGRDGIYVNLPERDAAVAMPVITKLSKEAGIKQIGYTSGCTVCKENAWHPMIKGHYVAEQILIKSGLAYTIFGLTMVMDMIPRYANNGKPFIMGKQPHPWSWIYSADFACMVSIAFSTPEALNKKFTIWGSEKSTISEAVDAYNRVFYPEAKPAQPKPYWVANLIALLVGTKLKYAISIFKYFEDHPEAGDPSEAYKLLGKPETSVREFIEFNKKHLA